MIAASYGRLDANAALAWAQSLSPRRRPSWRTCSRGSRVRIPRARSSLHSVLHRRSATPLAAIRHKSLLTRSKRPKSRPPAGGTGPWSGASAAHATVGAAPAARRATGCSRMARRLRGRVGQAAMSLARTDPSAAIGYPRHGAARAAREMDQRGRRRLRSERRARRSRLIQQHRGKPATTPRRRDRRQNRGGGRCRAGRGLLARSISRASAGFAGARAQIANAWAREDPAAAAAWAHELRNNDAETAATATIANQWVGRDPVAARSWTFGYRPAPRATPRSCNCWAHGRHAGGRSGRVERSRPPRRGSAASTRRCESSCNATRQRHASSPIATSRTLDAPSHGAVLRAGRPPADAIGPGPPRLPAAR